MYNAPPSTQTDVASKAEPDDGMGIPAFLRRQRTTETDAAIDRILAEQRSGKREYTMPKADDESKEGTMAKIDALISNRDAPVEVWTRKPDDDKDVHIIKRFSNMAEFEAWYDPRVWYYLGTHNSLEITAINLDLKSGGHRGLTTAAKSKVGRAVESGGVAANYIVNSHIGLVLKKYNFVRVGGVSPLLFRHASGHEVTITPPEPDKKSSSDWVLRLKGEPERGGRGLSLDGVLKGSKL